MSYYQSKTEAIDAALAIVKLGLESGAITTANTNQYIEDSTGKNAGAYLGELISELADRLAKL